MVHWDSSGEVGGVGGPCVAHGHDEDGVGRGDPAEEQRDVQQTEQHDVLKRLMLEEVECVPPGHIQAFLAR